MIEQKRLHKVTFLLSQSVSFVGLVHVLNQRKDKQGGTIKMPAVPTTHPSRGLWRVSILSSPHISLDVGCKPNSRNHSKHPGLERWALEIPFSTHGLCKSYQKHRRHRSGVDEESAMFGRLQKPFWQGTSKADWSRAACL